MAGRIQGITIEIGSDTTKLNIEVELDLSEMDLTKAESKKNRYFCFNQVKNEDKESKIHKNVI